MMANVGRENGFRWEPALYLQLLNAAVALVVAFGLPLSAEMTGAITIIATAVFTIVTAVMTRPIAVSVITGAVQSALIAVAAFGLELHQDQIGAVVTLLAIVLGLLTRQAVTPEVKTRAQADLAA